jgi:hypothetical protein
MVVEDDTEVGNELVQEVSSPMIVLPDLLYYNRHDGRRYKDEQEHHRKRIDAWEGRYRCPHSLDRALQTLYKRAQTKISSVLRRQLTSFLFMR